MPSVTRYNNDFGEWLAWLMEDRGITSSRQVTNRTDVSHTTIEDIVKRGRRPTLETAIKVALGFGEDVVAAVRRAGYDEIADAMERGSMPVPKEEREDVREPFMEDWIQAGYNLPEQERPETLQYVLWRTDRAGRHRTIGSKAQTEDEESTERERFRRKKTG